MGFIRSLIHSCRLIQASRPIEHRNKHKHIANTHNKHTEENNEREKTSEEEYEEYWIMMMMIMKMKLTMWNAVRDIQSIWRYGCSVN